MLATIRSAVKSIVVEDGTEVTDAMIEHATCKLVREVNNSRSRDKYKVWMLKKQTMILFCNNDVIKFYQKMVKLTRTKPYINWLCIGSGKKDLVCAHRKNSKLFQEFSQEIHARVCSSL